MTLEDKAKNYDNFKRYLLAIIGRESYAKIVEELGGEDAIMNASYATKTDTGLAYEGSLIDTVLTIASYADEINDLLPTDIQVDKRTIYKVCLLSHIAKVIMYKPNENQWAVEKFGTLYEFRDLPGSLRAGERSTMIAMNAGVTFNPEEFEAMRFLGLRDDDEMKYYSSTLSTIIKQATELVNIVAKNRNYENVPQQKQ